MLRRPTDDLTRYEQPARGPAGRAAAVALPSSTAELREVVRDAVRAGTRLIPQGANSGLVGASVPPPTGDAVVVCLDRLDGVVEFDPTEGVAVVRAGTRLSALAEVAAPHGLHLPVDLAADPSIGGMVATNTGGSRVMRYGPMRAHVLGLTAVAADADASSFGGSMRLRKDSRGLDPAHALVGSGGALGIVTEVVLTLAPLPRRIETWWLAVPDAARVPALFDVLTGARPGALSAFEFVSAAALEHTLAAPGAPASPFGGAVGAGVPDAVLVEWSASDDHSLDGLEDDIARAHELGLLVDGRLVDPAAGWGIRHRVSESLRTAGTVFGHDVSTPRHRLFAARAETIGELARVAPHGTVCDFGHVGDGGLHLNLVLPPGTDASDALRIEVRGVVDEIVARHGGSYSAEHGLGPVNAERWLATTPPLERRLVAAIKAVVDPHRILGHPDHPYNRLPPLELR